MKTTIQPARFESWIQPLRQPTVWRRAFALGATAGLAQAAINQGDRWLNHSVDSTVLVKTILSPLISFLLVLVSSAVTWAQRNFEEDNL